MSSKAKPVIFNGRLYKGASARDAKNMNYTVEDLLKMDLSGTELWLEHNRQHGVLGRVMRSWVDHEGWLCVQCCLNSPEELGSTRHEELRRALQEGQLPDLSIHWFGSADKATGVVDPQSKRILEVSLTKKGFFEGTHLLNVAAAFDSQSRPIVHYTTPPGKMAKTINLSDLADLETQYGVTFTDEERSLAQADPSGQVGAMIALRKMAEKSSTAEAELQNARAQAAAVQNMQEKIAAYEKEYAAQGQAQVKPMIESLSKANLPPEQVDLWTQGLTAIATNPQSKNTWALLQHFGTKALEGQKSMAELAKAQKQVTDLQKAQQQWQQQQQQHQQSESVGMKRSLDKTAADSGMPDSKFRPMGGDNRQLIEQAASADAAWLTDVDRVFPNAWGAQKSADHPGAQLMDTLISQSRLGVPMPTGRPTPAAAPAPVSSFGQVPFW